MKKIIAFGASSSIHSINKKLATYAASCVPNAQSTVLDLNDYEMPIFSVDRQNKDGFPQLAHDFKDLLMSSDGIIISFAEHNSSYSAAFKNIFDWISRFDGDIWYSKPMLLLATNDGDRGAKLFWNKPTIESQGKTPTMSRIFPFQIFQKPLITIRASWIRNWKLNSKTL
jgi:NAD(P)H-dependent FMN reductase